jgi:peptide/nickel transport system substrate-binding protein
MEATIKKDINMEEEKMTDLMKGRFDRRGFLKTTAAGALVASMPFNPAQAKPKRGGHFRIGIGSGDTTDVIDPANYGNTLRAGVSMAIHGRLTEVAPDGSLIPELAESWEASADAKTWRFKIRQGVNFHSGKPLTLEDVVASLNYHRGENTTSTAAPMVAQIKEIGTDGASTIVVELETGNADFPFILSDVHMTMHPAAGEGIDWKSHDGCGSYRLTEFNPGVIATLERNPNHWRDNVGWFDSIEILLLADVNARTTALISGEVDAIDRLDLKTAGLIARKLGIEIKSIAGTQHFEFAMSTHLAPFDNNHVRLALKHAINREELVEKILFGYGSVGNDIPIGRGQRYFNSELEQRSYDPDKAKWHLKEAGMDSLSISLSVADAAFAGAVDAGVLFQNSAKASGIDLDIIREPNDGYWSDVWMQKPFSAVYWNGRPVEDQMFSTAYSCGAAWNDTFWCNERFDKLMTEARAELNEETRKAMYFEMQEMIHNEGGALIPMYANYVFAMSDKVGISDQIGSSLDLDGGRWAERWWFA